MLTEKQKLSAHLFYQGRTVNQVAAEIGVHRTTIWRWYRNPAMVKYAQKYFSRQNNRIKLRSLKRKRSQLNKAFSGPDEETINLAANRELSLYTWAIFGDGEPPFMQHNRS